MFRFIWETGCLQAPCVRRRRCGGHAGWRVGQKRSIKFVIAFIFWSEGVRLAKLPGRLPKMSPSAHYLS